MQGYPSSLGNSKTHFGNPNENTSVNAFTKTVEWDRFMNYRKMKKWETFFQKIPHLAFAPITSDNSDDNQRNKHKDHPKKG